MGGGRKWEDETSGGREKIRTGKILLEILCLIKPRERDYVKHTQSTNGRYCVAKVGRCSVFSPRFLRRRASRHCFAMEGNRPVRRRRRRSYRSTDSRGGEFSFLHPYLSSLTRGRAEYSEFLLFWIVKFVRVRSLGGSGVKAPKHQSIILYARLSSSHRASVQCSAVTKPKA